MSFIASINAYSFQSHFKLDRFDQMTQFHLSWNSNDFIASGKIQWLARVRFAVIIYLLSDDDMPPAIYFD